MKLELRYFVVNLEKHLKATHNVPRFIKMSAKALLLAVLSGIYRCFLSKQRPSSTICQRIASFACMAI